MRKRRTSEDEGGPPRREAPTRRPAGWGCRRGRSRRWRARDRGPAYVKLGKRRCYRVADLHAFITAGTVSPEAA